jgi:hypothetical protein
LRRGALFRARRKWQPIERKGCPAGGGTREAAFMVFRQSLNAVAAGPCETPFAPVRTIRDANDTGNMMPIAASPWRAGVAATNV